MKFSSICVLGLGYIGLPTASTFAASGLKVIGVDVNPTIVTRLRNGDVHIQEPGLRDTFQSALASGQLTIASQPTEADAYLIAVPTPFHDDRAGEFVGRRYRLADLRAVIAATESIVPFLRRGNLVVLESTSPPRTTVDRVAPILARSGLVPGRDFNLAYSPERVLPGQILRDLRENARVVGGVTPDSSQTAADLYSVFVTGEILQTDSTTAELVKLMENTYRDVNIAIANEFSRLADRFGVDVWEAINLANRHPRVKILKPGPGVGGHCISVDPWFLVEAAPELATLIHSARNVNDAQPHYVVGLVKRALSSLGGKKIAALGLAYKADVDDLRESPAAEVVRLLGQEGAIVRAWEPSSPNTDLPGIAVAESLDAALADADGILLLVAHDGFLKLKPDELARRTKCRVIIDAVNGWNAPEWQHSDFRITRLGVGK